MTRLLGQPLHCLTGTGSLHRHYLHCCRRTDLSVEKKQHKSANRKFKSGKCFFYKHTGGRFLKVVHHCFSDFWGFCSDFIFKMLAEMTLLLSHLTLCWSGIGQNRIHGVALRGWCRARNRSLYAFGCHPICMFLTSNCSQMLKFQNHSSLSSFIPENKYLVYYAEKNGQTWWMLKFQQWTVITVLYR